MTDELLHVTTAEDWTVAQAAGGYGQPAGGFIHLCTPAQLDFVLGRHFAGRSGLVVLTVETGGSDVRWETSEPGMAPFLHLYGPCPRRPCARCGASDARRRRHAVAERG
ncbi:MAG: DUF952 domain-containing protein [Geminicoccaceae bacterium]